MAAVRAALQRFGDAAKGGEVLAESFAAFGRASDKSRLSPYCHHHPAANSCEATGRTERNSGRMRHFTGVRDIFTLLHRPFTSVTRVQIPSGTPMKSSTYTVGTPWLSVSVPTECHFQGRFGLPLGRSIGLEKGTRLRVYNRPSWPKIRQGLALFSQFSIHWSRVRKSLSLKHVRVEQREHWLINASIVRRASNRAA